MRDRLKKKFNILLQLKLIYIQKLSALILHFLCQKL
jgi:hypothetical protein